MDIIAVTVLSPGQIFTVNGTPFALTAAGELTHIESPERLHLVMKASAPKDGTDGD